MEENKTEPAEQSSKMVFTHIIETFTRFYTPAASLADADDIKTTLDLIDEMESIATIYPIEVSTALTQAGFKLHYTGTQYVWLLKNR